MSKDEVSQKLCDAIQRFQELSGERKPKLTPETVPIGELPGFDSQRAMEVLVEVEGLLGCGLEGDVNLFVSKDGRHPLNIGQITNRIFNLITRHEDLVK
jgi:hypothetical protein